MFLTRTGIKIIMRIRYMVLFLSIFYLVPAYAVVDNTLPLRMQSLTLEERANNSTNCTHQENIDQSDLEKKTDTTYCDERTQTSSKESKTICKWLLASKAKTICILGVPVAVIVSAMAGVSLACHSIVTPPVQLHLQRAKRFKSSADQKETDQKATDQKATDQEEAGQVAIDQEKIDLKRYNRNLEFLLASHNWDNEWLNAHHLQSAKRFKRSADPEETDKKATDKKATDQKAIDPKATDQEEAGQVAIDQKKIDLKRHNRNLEFLLASHNWDNKWLNAHQLMSAVTEYKAGILCYQNNWLLSKLKNLNDLSSRVSKDIQINNEYDSIKFGFLAELQMSISSSINQVSELLQHPNVEYSEKILLEVKQNDMILAGRFDYINEIDFKGSVILDGWEEFQNSNFIDVDKPGDPIAMDLCSNPFEFMKDNMVLLSNSLRNKKDTQFSDNLKLIKGDGNIYFLAEDASGDESGTFSGGWLSSSSSQGDDIVKYIDIPKASLKKIFIFTEILTIGSVYVTDYNEKFYRVFLDSRSGLQHDYVNVVSRITSMDYKKTSSDVEVANIIMFFDAKGWHTVLNSRKPRHVSKRSVQNSLQTGRQRRSPNDGIKKIPQWVKWTGENFGNVKRGYKNHPLLQKDMLSIMKEQKGSPGAVNRPMLANEMKYRTVLHSGALSRSYMSYVSKPGRAIVLTYGKNYHSSLLVFDSRQGGPVLLSSGDDEFRRTFTQGTKKLLTMNAELGVKNQLYSMGVKRDNVVRLNGLDTDAMVDTWENTVQKKRYTLLKQNCAKSVRDVLISGTKPYMRTHQDGSLRTTFKNDKIRMLPKDTAKLAGEIKILIDEKPKRQEKVLAKMHKNEKHIFNTKKFVEPNAQKRSSLYNSKSRSSLNLYTRKDVSRIRRLVQSYPQSSRSVYRTKVPVKLESFSYYKKEQRQTKMNTFKQTIMRRSRLLNSGLSKIKTRIGTGMLKHGGKVFGAAGAAGAIILGTLQEVHIFVKNHLMYNDFSEHDKNMYREYLTITGITSFIPMVGTIVRGFLSCGAVDCVTKENARENNNLRYSQIVNVLSDGKSMFMPSVIRDDIAMVMTVPLKSFHKMYIADGKTYEMHATPVREENGFSKNLELTSPFEQKHMEGKQWVFVVIEHIELNGSITKNIVCAGVNGQLLQSNLEKFEQTKEGLSSNYDMVSYNIKKWMYPIYTVEERREYWDEIYFKTIKCNVGSRISYCIKNPLYSEKDGWARIWKEINESKKEQKDYIINMRNKYDLNAHEEDFFGHYNKLELDLTKIENSDYHDVNKVSDYDYIKHCSALIDMIVHGINSVESLISYTDDAEGFVSRRYTAQDMKKRIKLPVRTISVADFKHTVDSLDERFEFFAEAYDMMFWYNKPKRLESIILEKGERFYDNPYAIVKNKIKKFEYMGSPFGSAPSSYSKYLDLLTLSENDITPGLLTLSKNDIGLEALSVASETLVPRAFFSFESISDSDKRGYFDFSLQHIKPCLGYMDSEGNIYRYTPSYDAQVGPLADSINVNIEIRRHRCDHIEYYQDSLSWVTLDPQPTVVRNQYKNKYLEIKGLHKAGLYSLKTTEGKSYNFMLSANDLESTRPSMLSMNAGFCLLAGDQRYMSVVDLIARMRNQFGRDLNVIRYYHDVNKKMFIPYQLGILNDLVSAASFEDGMSYMRRLCDFFSGVHEPTNEHVQALEMMLDLPLLNNYDFSDNIQALVDFIKRNATEKDDVEIKSITNSLDSLDLTTRSTSMQDDDYNAKKTNPKARKVRSVETIVGASSLSNTNIEAESPESLRSTIEHTPIHMETSSDKDGDAADEHAWSSADEEAQRDHKSRSSEGNMNRYYVAGGVIVALAASNFNNLDDSQEFNDLKEIKVKKTDDKLSWLELSHISPERTFCSSENVEKKQMLVLNWHLHRMANLEEVNKLIRRSTHVLDKDSGLMVSQEWAGFFGSKRARESFFSDIVAMGYTISSKDDIEVIVDCIDELPWYLQDEVKYCTIREVLKYFVPTRKLSTFINSYLPKLSELQVTEKGIELGDDRKFLVGNAPWFAVMNRMYSIDWFEENISDRDSSRLFADLSSKGFDFSRWFGFLLGDTEFDKRHKERYPAMNHVFADIISHNHNIKISEICNPDEITEKWLIDIGVYAEVNGYLNSQVIVPKNIFSVPRNALGISDTVDSIIILDPIFDDTLSDTQCDCNIIYVRDKSTLDE
ncbi:MAG: hypothetical protein QS748_09785 [Candidatus Endonucleobacter bathymodioli]|uniref:Uncharacterized protein n=1 Tax=Candidatus Endonucleibacter bathymodioli TaxID=539814 RepID=A0AA90P1Q1_9GAMM|nr:hypothetical protein [Candidatus Endonucleobacter bathymodioli]